MTANQIAYQNLLETSRSNLARETETNRANLAQEALKLQDLQEQARHNIVYEHETNRANVARETETHRANRAAEIETNRSNLARELEANRHNVAQESLTQRGQDVGLYSTLITNASNAAQTAAKIAADKYAAELGYQGRVDTAYINANKTLSTVERLPSTASKIGKAVQSWAFNGLKKIGAIKVPGGQHKSKTTAAHGGSTKRR